jgi:hypothetical protein
MKLKVAGALVLAAVTLAGCGGDKPATAPGSTAGKVVQGESETGMKLKVESFLPPASDPLLKKLDAYRAAAGYPAVDYHRVTATAGAIPDRLRVVTFASSAEDIPAGKGVEARFGCDALNYEWVPNKKVSTATFDQLKASLCTVKPDDAEGIQAGARTVYYLVTDRSFAERGLREKKIFGPRDVEFMAVS